LVAFSLASGLGGVLAVGCGAHLADHRVRSSDRRVADAVRAFTRDRGQPPSELGVLVPRYLAAVPRAGAACGSPLDYQTESVSSRILWWDLRADGRAREVMGQAHIEPITDSSPAGLLVELVNDRVEIVATTVAAVSPGTLRGSRDAWRDSIETTFHGHSAGDVIRKLGAPSSDTTESAPRWWLCADGDVVWCGGEAGRCSKAGWHRWARWPDAVRLACSR
jgi:hypothetical protein